MSKRDLIARARVLGCLATVDVEDHEQRTITIQAPAGQHFASGDHALAIFSAEQAQDAYAYAYRHLLDSLPLEPCDTAMFDCLQAASSRATKPTT